MCLAALLCEKFFIPIREWRCQDIDEVLLHKDQFFYHLYLRTFNSSEVLGKNSSPDSEYTADYSLLVSGEKR